MDPTSPSVGGRRPWITFGTLLIWPAAVQCQSGGSGPVPETSIAQEAQLPVLAEGGEQAALELEYQVQCSRTDPGVGLVIVSWTPPEEAGLDQRVDVTTNAAGFELGDFTSLWQMRRDTTGVLLSFDEARDRYDLVLTGLTPGVNYYWRILTLTGQGWVPTVAEPFKAPVCPVDVRIDTVRVRG